MQHEWNVGDAAIESAYFLMKKLAAAQLNLRIALRAKSLKKCKKRNLRKYFEVENYLPEITPAMIISLKQLERSRLRFPQMYIKSLGEYTETLRSRRFPLIACTGGNCSKITSSQASRIISTGSGACARVSHSMELWRPWKVIKPCYLPLRTAMNREKQREMATSRGATIKTDEFKQQQL